MKTLANRDAKTDKEKPAKAFSVYADKSKHTMTATATRPQPQRSSPLKRTATDALSSRPTKQSRLTPSTNSFLRRGPPETQTISKATLESLVEQKVAEILAQREANATVPKPQLEQTEREQTISAEVQARLDSIEKRLEGQDGERAEGLSYLFMAKQHQARGEDASALRMYELAQPFFPSNEKLERKIEKLRAKQETRPSTWDHKAVDYDIVQEGEIDHEEPAKPTKRRKQITTHQDFTTDTDADESYQASDQEPSYHDTYESDTSIRKPRKKSTKKHRPSSPDPLTNPDSNPCIPTPRTNHIISILNSRSISKLKALNGLGAKKAEAIVEYLDTEDRELGSWDEVLGLDVRGIGRRSWEGVRDGVVV